MKCGSPAPSGAPKSSPSRASRPRPGFGTRCSPRSRPRHRQTVGSPPSRAPLRVWHLAQSALSWYAPANGSVAPRTRHPTSGGPIAVLASSATGSAAEDFLAAFHAARRGVIIGEPSAGSAGDVATFALPKGWGVQFCVTRHTFPDGTEFAGLGVPPDVLVVPTVDGMLARSEPALARALACFEGGGARP